MRPMKTGFEQSKSEKLYSLNLFYMAFDLIELEKCQWFGEPFEQI